MEFTFEEKTDMFAAYVLSGRAPAAALSEYRVRFPNRRAPSLTYFAKLEKSLRNFGRFDRVPKSFPAEELETAILAHLALDDRMSSRQVAQLCNTTHPTVLLVPRKHGLKPYKVPKVQMLADSDKPRRLSFCRWFIENQERDPRFYMKLMWSDESNFTNRGFFNRKNTHYWAEGKQSVFAESNPQTRVSINVWCGLLGSRVIGPYFYEGTLDGARYRQFLTNHLLGILDDMPLARRTQVIFMQDGAPPHNADETMILLRQMFPGRVLANRGDIRWPARSPDLTPLDFYLWGKVKDLVYAEENLPFRTLADLTGTIEEVFDALSRDEVRAATQSVLHRCRSCEAQGGGQFEHIL